MRERKEFRRHRERRKEKSPPPVGEFQRGLPSLHESVVVRVQQRDMSKGVGSEQETHAHTYSTCNTPAHTCTCLPV
jgi:hypothetical protein